MGMSVDCFVCFGIIVPDKFEHIDWEGKLEHPFQAVYSGYDASGPRILTLKETIEAYEPVISITKWRERMLPKETTELMDIKGKWTDLLKNKYREFFGKNEKPPEPDIYASALYL